MEIKPHYLFERFSDLVVRTHAFKHVHVSNAHRMAQKNIMWHMQTVSEMTETPVAAENVQRLLLMTQNFSFGHSVCLMSRI
jgi:hypothetical protein